MKSIKKEKGSALLFSLAMLGLLMLMGLAYSLSARTNLEVAKAFRNSSVAERTALDATNTTVQDMRNMFLSVDAWFNVTGYHYNSSMLLDYRCPFYQGSTTFAHAGKKMDGNFNFFYKNMPWRNVCDDTWESSSSDLPLSYVYMLDMFSNKAYSGGHTSQGDQDGVAEALHFRTGFRRSLLPGDPDEPADRMAINTFLGTKEYLLWRHIRDMDDNFNLSGELDVNSSSHASTYGGAITGRFLSFAILENNKIDPDLLLQQEQTDPDKRIIEPQYFFDSLKDDCKLDLNKSYSINDFEPRNNNSIVMGWNSLEEMFHAGTFGNPESKQAEEDALVLSDILYPHSAELEAYQLVETNGPEMMEQDNGNELVEVPRLVRTDMQAVYPAMHRFNLQRLGISPFQGTAGVEKLLDGEDEVKSFWKENIPEQEVNITETSDSIPWLSQIRVEGDTDFIDPSTPAREKTNAEIIFSPKSKALQKQVAANLLDFCDKDHVPTTNYDEDDPYNTETYCGQEKVPCIHKIIFELKVEWDSTTKKHEIKDAYAHVTLMNMGDIKEGSSGSVSIQCENFVTSRWKSNVWHSNPCVHNIPLKSQNYTISTKSGDTKTVSIRLDGSLLDQVPWVWSQEGGNYGAFVAIDKMSVVLKNGADIFDVVTHDRNKDGNMFFVPQNGIIWWGSNIATTTLVDGGNYNIKCGLVFPDPRCNDSVTRCGLYRNLLMDNAKVSNPSYHDDDYEDDKSAFYQYGVASKQLIMPGYPDGEGRVDDTKLAGVDYDIEDYNDLSKISTSFIRNEKVESMWELGAIHRGEPFRTLNFCNSGVTGLYKNGDARVIDEIKLDKRHRKARSVRLSFGNCTAGSITYPRKEVMSQIGNQKQELDSASSKQALREQWRAPQYAFLRAVKKHADTDSYDDNPSSNLQFTTTEIDEVINNLYRYDCVWRDGHPSVCKAFHAVGFGRGRSGYARTLCLDSAVNNRQQEELFGKLGHLLGDRYFTYRIVSTAEEVHKLTMTPVEEKMYLDFRKSSNASERAKVPENWVYVNEDGWYKIRGRAKVMTQIHRDVYSDSFKIIKQQVLEE